MEKKDIRSLVCKTNKICHVINSWLVTSLEKKINPTNTYFMLTTIFITIIMAILQKSNFLITQTRVDKFVYPFFGCVIYNHTSGYNYHSMYFVL